MNRPYACKLLTVANEQRHGFVKLRGIQADHEVRLMVQAGLVEATFGEDKEGSFTSINSVTEAGQTLLQTSKDHSAVPAPVLVLPRTKTAAEKQSDSQAAVLEKWSVKFALSLSRPEEGA